MCAPWDEAKAADRSLSVKIQRASHMMGWR
jgi:hypothetical protein